MSISPIDRRSKSQTVAFVLIGILLAIYALSFILPFLWVLIQSLKTGTEFYDSKLAFPTSPVFSNYRYALFEMTYKKVNFMGMFFNNAVLAVLMTAVGVISPCIMAYVIAKYPFAICKILFGVALAIQVIPTVGALPSMYRLASTIGMRNNFGLIWLLNAGGFGFNFFILHSGFKTISATYAEAGKIDGAGHLRIFLQIILPQAIPYLISVSITTFILQWNEYLTAFLYMDKKPTLSLGLYELGQKLLYESGNITPLFAGIIISLIPTIIIFMLFQNTIMKNTGVGGIKG